MAAQKRGKLDDPGVHADVALWGNLLRSAYSMDCPGRPTGACATTGGCAAARAQRPESLKVRAGASGTGRGSLRPRTWFLHSRQHPDAAAVLSRASGEVILAPPTRRIPTRAKKFPQQFHQLPRRARDVFGFLSAVACMNLRVRPFRHQQRSDLVVKDRQADSLRHDAGRGVRIEMIKRRPADVVVQRSDPRQCN